MNAFVTISQPQTTAQILAAAIATAANHSTIHAITISETSTAPFILDEETEPCLDAAGNLCIAMTVKGTDINVYFKTAAHGEIEVSSQDVTPALEPYNDRYYDTSYNAHTVEKDALCCVIQAESVFVSEGAIFRLTEQQAHRINEALAAHSVDNTPTIHHA